MDKQKYRHIIEFLILKKKSPKDIYHELLDTYGDDCPSKTTVYFWCSEIRHGRKSLEDDPRSGRPCTATSPQLCEEILLTVRADRRVTVRRLAEIHGVSKSSIDVILRERLHMKKLCARWVPRMLLLQDNAPPHTSQIAIAAADQCGYRLLPHPPYSPDLAPSDYYLFANLKLHVKGRRYNTDCDVMDAVDEFFEGCSADWFKRGLAMLENRWQACIVAKGDYFEK